MEEKMDGTLNRSMFAGIKVFELVLSMYCINTIIVLIQMFFTCFVSFVLFSNPIQITSGLFAYMLLMLQISWNGFFCGLIGGVLSPTKICGVYMVTAMLLTQFFLSGAIWPIEGQPYLLKILSEILPIRLVGNAMNNIALKGWTLNHPLIIKGTTLSLVYNIVLVLVLIILGKFKKDLWVQYKQ